MQGSPFPFFVSNNTITYTELKKRCAVDYHTKGTILIAMVKQGLNVYQQAQTARKSLEALLFLEAQALELSCLNNEWIDFSNAVFESVLVSSPQINNQGIYHNLENLFQKTLQRLGTS